jgi:uncharacterized membrane protein
MKRRFSNNDGPQKPGPQTNLEEDVSIHIFDTSATMVGVCLTVIGLFRLMLQLKSISTWADDLLSIDATLFLSACGLAYWALRTRSLKRRHRTEKIADLIFLGALTLMTAICGLITYTLI